MFVPSSTLTAAFQRSKHFRAKFSPDPSSRLGSGVQTVGPSHAGEALVSSLYIYLLLRNLLSTYEYTYTRSKHSGLSSNYGKWCNSNHLFCNLIGLHSRFNPDPPRVRGSGLGRLHIYIYINNVDPNSHPCLLSTYKVVLRIRTRFRVWSDWLNRTRIFTLSLLLLNIN